MTESSVLIKSVVFVLLPSMKAASGVFSHILAVCFCEGMYHVEFIINNVHVALSL
jgi:hypothetical protein